MKIERVLIEGFRGINERIEIKPRRINIIVGRNNTGKSSILDGISLLIPSFNNYKDVLGKNIIRDVLYQTKKISVKYLINSDVDRIKGCITASFDNGEVRKLDIYKYKIENRLKDTNYDAFLDTIETHIINKFKERLHSALVNIIDRYSFRIESENLRMLYHNLLKARELLKDYRPEEAKMLLEEIDHSLKRIDRDTKIRKITEELYNELSNTYIDQIKKTLTHSNFHFIVTYIDDKIKWIDWIPTENIVIPKEPRYMLEEIPEFILEFSRYTRRLTPSLFYHKLVDFLVMEYDTNTPVRIHSYEQKNDSKDGDSVKLPFIYITNRGGLDIYDINDLYSKVYISNLKNDVLTLLNDFNIQDISIIEEDNKPYIYVIQDNISRNIATLGDGFVKLLKLVFSHTLVENGILLVEEPESSLHPGYIVYYVNILINSILSNTNQQIFLTTHSRELIQYLLKLASELDLLDDVVVYHLHKIGSNLYFEEIYGKDAYKQVVVIEEDLRGI